MFLTGTGLPKSVEQTELIVEVKNTEPEEIVTDSRPANKVSSGPSKDLRAYVLDEFKDILFPRQKNKFELAHDKAIAIQVQSEQREQREYRKRILQLAEQMQYDDDIEESVVQFREAATELNKP